MDWFTLTLILSFVATILVMILRAITDDTNPFAFMSIVVGASAVILYLICSMKGISIGLQKNVVFVAMFAGTSVSILDLGFIFMFRKGAQVSVAMPLFRICAILISLVVGIFFLNEEITLIKSFGILTACFAVYFLLVPSAKNGEIK